MKPFDVSQCQISTLSPLHLGCGEDYLPTHYVLKDGYLHAYGDAALLQALGPAGLERLVNTMESGRPDAILNVRREVLNHADRLVPIASHRVWAAPGVASLYQSRITSVAQKESNRRITNELAIQRTFSNPYSHLPVLPGSAVKGAIRTAWLDHLNRGQAADRAEKPRQLEQRLLGNSHITDDPFSLLKVSDATYESEPGIKPGEVWFAVSRKRRPHPERKASGVSTLLECIGAGRDGCFRLDMRFFDASHRSTSTAVPASRQQLAKICNAYYVPKLLQELEQLADGAGYLDNGWAKTIKNLLTGELRQALLDHKAMILRLGKHSGAEDKTLNGARSIRIKTPKDQRDKYQSHTNEVRLAAQSKQENASLLPFGWVLVEFDDTPPLPGVRTLLAELSAPAAARRKQEQQLRETRKQALAQQAQEQQRAREQAEAAARAEAEQAQRQAELAKQPPEIQAMAAFEDALRANPAARGEGPSGQLYEQLRELVLSAANWPEPHRRACRELMATGFEFLGINRKKSKKAKELWKSLGDDA